MRAKRSVLDPATAKIPWRRRGARALGAVLAVLLTLTVLEGGARLALALVDGVRGRPDLFIDVVHMSPRGYGVVAQQTATTWSSPDRILR